MALTLDSMTNMNIIDEFRARRRKVLRLAGPWILIGVIGSLVSIYYGKDPSAPLSQSTGMILVAGAFMACIIVGASIVLRYYRCPAFGIVPVARNVILFCLCKFPTFGVRLK